MKRPIRPRPARGIAALVGAAAIAVVPAAHAADALGLTRTQEIALRAGWNAVYLEVEPADPAPAQVFAGLPVDRVAALFENPVSNQFVSDPGVDLFKGKGWGVWYAPGLPEAFLKSLDAVEGNRAYLIHARSACQWRLTGSVGRAVVRWQADAYNLVGFPVRAVGGPTLGEFFAGSKAHRGQAIYRLVDGRWKKVAQASAEVMRAGEAFWVYCRGASDYQGPLRVETASRAGLVLGKGAAELVLRNECPHPLVPVVEQVAGGEAPLPLSFVVRAFGNPAAPVAPVGVRMPAAAWEQPLPALESGAAVAAPVECRIGEMTRPRQGSLLKITTDIGTETWIPVTAVREDLGQ